MIQTIKCPGCGSRLLYDPGSGKLKCPNCGTTAEIADANAGFPDLSVKAPEESVENSGSGERIYQCRNCGGTLTADEFTAVTNCPYCSYPAFIESRLTGDLKPDRVIPFAFDKKQAQNYFRNWTGSGRLTPSAFRSQAVMDKVTGVYVPFWLYSYTAEVSLDADASISKTTKTGSTETVVTEHYKVHREDEGRYEYVPANASGKVPDDAMAVLEPFDYEKLQEFAMPYLSGFSADRMNHGAEQYEEKVKAQIREDAVEAAREQIEGYDEVEVEASDVVLKDSEALYALLPVWMLSFMYFGKEYRLFMNGQTGKIDGTLPVSRVKVLAVFLIAFAVIFLLMFLILR